MAQAARALDHAPSRRPQLRVAPPPRRPSPEVIRRRRVVALAALALLVALPVVVLGALGGGSTARDQIGALLTAGASHPATLCDHLSRPMLAAVGGHDACVAASPEKAPAATVEAIEVNGATASARVVRDSGEELVRLVRQDGDWKVDDVR